MITAIIRLQSIVILAVLFFIAGTSFYNDLTGKLYHRKALCSVFTHTIFDAVKKLTHKKQERGSHTPEKSFIYDSYR
jgi:hypothetical protein